jgi:pyruvate/2-oxoglutarate dehydrogenase complex dihydrolipoamide acyltransferase (E2) component
MTKPIIAPQANVNDEQVTVVEWKVSDGSAVRRGDVVVVVESSKSVEEICASDDGFLRIGAQAGAEVAVGEILGWIAADATQPARSGQAANLAAPAAPRKATDKARQLARSHGIDLSQVVARGIITEHQVQQLIDQQAVGAVAEPDPASGRKLDAIQQRALKVVLQAKAEQAPAHLLGECDVSQTLGLLKALSEAQGMMSSLTLGDLLIHQVSRVLRDFPELNGSLVGDTVQLHPHVSIGTTVDVDGHLYLLTIADADKLSLKEIALRRLSDIMELMRGRYKPASASASTFSVTVLSDPAARYQLPIIFPGQAGIVGLGGVQRTLRLGRNDLPEAASVVGLSLAYDHRFINGFAASRFLAAVAARLTTPVLEAS